MNTTIKKRIEEINSGRVPEGYEKTSFGIFPCDWEKSKTLKDLGKFGKGRGIPGNKLISEGVPCVGYGDIYMKYNYHFEKAQSFVDENTAAESQKICKGTLLFTATGETAEEIGKCVCYNGEEDIYAGGDIITFVPDRINSMFIAYQQYQNYALRQKASFGQGHSVVHIQKDRLEKLHIAYPQSAQEQSRIAEILMQWDKAIKLQEKYIKQLELRKKALMQRLLTPKDGWKKLNINMVMKEEIVKSTINNQYPVVSSTTKGLFLQSEYFDKMVASKDNVGYKILKRGQVVLSPQNLWMGNINYNREIEIGIVSPSYKIFSINSDYNEEIIAQILKSDKMLEAYKNSSEQGASIVRRNLDIDLFYQINFYYPKEVEVDIIANTIKSANIEFAFQNNKLDKLIEQRKALQQYLLTGIVRV